MKIFYFTSVFILIYCSGFSQAVFQNITYGEKQELGLMLKLPNKVEVVENTILQKLEETGYKPETKGALFWKSALYLILSKGYDNFVSLESDSASYRAARRFLNGFIKETAAYKLAIVIEEEQERIDDSEKKLKIMKEDENELQRKMDDIKKI